jgi:uncharacterized protein (TIGR03435 family)
VRKFVLSFLALVFGAGVAAAQTFEVASIKSAPPLDPQKILSGQQRVGMKVAGSNVDIESEALPELLYQAFKVRPSQMKGPDWLNTTDPLAVLSAARFNIHAKLPPGATEEQVPQLLQALLAERFGLAIHHEQKEQNVYALVVGKDGPKLEPSPPDDPKPADGAPQTTRPDPIQVSGNPQTGMTIRAPGNGGTMRMQMGQDGVMRMTADKVTLEAIAASVERFVDRPVVDQTGLKGNYKMSLELSIADVMAAARASGVPIGNAPPGFGGGAAPAAGPSDPGGNPMLQSIEKMGLKLEPRKASVDYLVIDHLEKTPTED